MTIDEAIAEFKRYDDPGAAACAVALRAMEILLGGMTADHEAERAYCRAQVEARFGSGSDADADWLMELRAEARAEREPPDPAILALLIEAGGWVEDLYEEPVSSASVHRFRGVWLAAAQSYKADPEVGELIQRTAKAAREVE